MYPAELRNNVAACGITWRYWHQKAVVRHEVTTLYWLKIQVYWFRQSRRPVNRHFTDPGAFAEPFSEWRPGNTGLSIRWFSRYVFDSFSSPQDVDLKPVWSQTAAGEPAEAAVFQAPSLTRPARICGARPSRSPSRRRPGFQSAVALLPGFKARARSSPASSRR